MKRVLIITITLFTIICSVSAKTNSEQIPRIKFNGAEYSLYYSIKNTNSGTYLNEYYKQGQTYTMWDELLALHHYPNAYSPTVQAKEFRAYLTELGLSSELNEYDDNSAVLDFVIVDGKRRPIILEFNVFRFVKSPICGSYGMQYAKRYRLNNAIEADKVAKELYKTRSRYIKKLNNMEIPPLITENIDKGVIVSHEGVNENYNADFK